MTFSLHQGGVVMSSQVNHTHTVIKIHPLAHILDPYTFNSTLNINNLHFVVGINCKNGASTKYQGAGVKSTG